MVSVRTGMFRSGLYIYTAKESSVRSDNVPLMFLPQLQPVTDAAAAAAIAAIAAPLKILFIFFKN